jgi:hypothetical protein
LLTACAHIPRTAPHVPRAPRIDSPRMQSADADAPASIAAAMRVTHDAAISRLDRDDACFVVTLRATAGESQRLHRPGEWSARLAIDARAGEVDVEAASVRPIASDDETVTALRLVHRPPPITCGASAWTTLAPLTPLLYVAPIPSLIWLATEMPRHDRICRASERTRIDTHGESEVESVRAEVCFARDALLRDAEAMELRVDDPVRDDAPVRFHWSLSR